MTEGRFVRVSQGWEAGENNLTEAEEIQTDYTGSPARRKLIFIYDERGRQVQTEEYAWTGYTWGQYGTTNYLYSGWNIIAELDGSLALEKTYVWGLDQAEKNDYRATNGWTSIGRASGGVGGLVLIRDHNQNDGHFVHSDANGNVIGLIDGDGNGELSAAYDYDAFGNLLRAEGDAADLNPFRFSTKYQDNFTGLYWYGYRYYSPGQGRFLNRDPIGERGGANLYGFVGNDPVNNWDYLGLARQYICCSEEQVETIKAAEKASLEATRGGIRALNTFTPDYIMENYSSIRRFGSEIQGLGNVQKVLNDWHSDLDKNLRRIRDGLEGNMYLVECMQEDGDGRHGAYGEAPNNPFARAWQGARISLYPAFFRLVEPHRRGQVFLHEASHLYAFTKDYDTGFFWEDVSKWANDAAWVEGLVPDPEEHYKFQFGTLNKRIRSDHFSE